MKKEFNWLVCLMLSFAGVFSGKALLFCAYAQETGVPLTVSQSGTLVYTADSLGNRIPDFSYAGYQAGLTAIPHVPVKVHVPLMADGEDASKRIQAAIDYVSQLPIDEHGFRGAVLLEPGTYQLAGSLRIGASGVVLRGSGMHEGGTVLLGTGKSRETLITVAGLDDRTLNETPCTIVDEYVPVNTMELTLAPAHNIKKGDYIVVTRPSTELWVNEIGMQKFGGDNNWLGWKAGEFDMGWDRQVVDVKDGLIVLDAPLTTAIEQRHGGGFLTTYHWSGRITEVGIENLVCKSTYDDDNPRDEDHRWTGILVENAMDVWVRQVTFRHFAGSAVMLRETAKRITVEDCKSLHPVSEIAAHRRNSFFTAGQQTLFQRIYAEYGYHDFAVGYGAVGLNAFVQCESHLPFNYSGAIGSWVSGVLFDMINIDGHALGFPNRGPEAQGTGWTGANSVIWQCSAARIDCYRPPGANNWAFGTWARYAGDGSWYLSDTHVKPRSLYYAQLADRIGTEVWERSFLSPMEGETSSSPTAERAAELTKMAYEPAISLYSWIDSASSQRPISVQLTGGLLNANDLATDQTSPQSIQQNPLQLKQGWLTIDDKIVAGKRHNVMWWRGSLRKPEVAKATPHLTRFVPGHTGTGYTDNLEEVASWMVKENIIAIDHNYGLWYDRRRDDHQRVRRMDADAWAPFYELPFARSGKGTAWDGLSKYDLTQYNSWYWNRLRRFTDIADTAGLILIHQHYFQHNILEAGAHYADFPWRTANNINDVGFPEPPNYAGDKRIFMDEQFYDVSHPVRREIHRAYIRQCLANFSNNINVLHSIGAEFTGPLHFVEFWLDVIKEWEEEKGRDVLVGLSTTKDVQDAILNDPMRAKWIDIIDIRYWHEQSDGETYAPEGGKHLAPRQHARLQKPGKVSFESVYRAVLEYRTAYPDKAVVFSASNADAHGWSALMGGGSLVNLPKEVPEDLWRSVLEMKPKKQSGNEPAYILEGRNGTGLYFLTPNMSMTVDLTPYQGDYRVVWIDPKDGKIIRTDKMPGGEKHHFSATDNRDTVIWIEEQ
ncbi:DUF6298 domain-containing protein [Parapedobacter tibetensis]|uniref:DUF6298 domain-containing protein n=1 Tax=Parapedobacter tibetensis TaxID=2972951 RepID=UPI00214DB48E|nr:DUF6298 domain-containing protein [Parapedobacter tibetensis]